jgi:hypothetical protein
MQKLVSFSSFIRSLLLTAIVIYFAFSVYPSFTEGSTDRTVLRYLGMVISNGGVLYKDVFENKPPLLSLIQALAYKIHYHASWYFMAGFVVLAALALFTACKKVKAPYPLLFSILFAGLMYSPTICVGGELVRQYVACCVMICFACVFFENSFSYFFFGFFMVLIFFLIPTEVMILLPLFVYRFFCEKPINTTIKKRIIIIAGMMFGAMPSCAYLTINDVWWNFIDNSIIFNLSWYQHKGLFIDKALLCFQIVRSSPLTNFLCLIVTLFIIIFLIIPNKNRLFTLFTIGCFGIQILFFGIVEHMHISYLYSVISLFFMLLLSFFQIAPLFFTIKLVRFFLLSIVLYVILISGKPFYYSFSNKELKKDMILKSFPQVHQVKNMEGQLYVFHGMTAAELNISLNVKSPVYWPLLFPWQFWPDKWDKEGSIFQRDIIESVEKSRCRFLIDASGNFKLKHIKADSLWKSYVLKHYLSDTIIYSKKEKIILWERKL